MEAAQLSNASTVTSYAQHNARRTCSHLTVLHVLQLRAQAKQLLIKHEFQQAEDVLTHALQLRPGAYKLLRLRSVAFACLQQYQRSLQVAQHHKNTCTLSPSHASPHVQHDDAG